MNTRATETQTEDRTALQCVAYCLTNRITPRRYYEADALRPYQQGDDNVGGVPKVVHEAWNQLPSGVCAFAEKPARI